MASNSPENFKEIHSKKNPPELGSKRLRKTADKPFDVDNQNTEKELYSELKEKLELMFK